MFGLRYWGGTRWLFRLLGMGPRRSGVTVTGTELRVRAFPFRIDVPNSAVASAGEARTPWWAIFGVHTNSRGRWVINAALGPLVRVGLAIPQPAGFFGLRVRVSRLDLGVTDTAGLLHRVGARG